MMVPAFIETICIRDGIPRHPEWHQQRIGMTFQHCIPDATPFSLAEVLTQYIFPPGLVKCTITYAAEIIEVVYTPYIRKKINDLKLINIPDGFEYHFKYADRSIINQLFEIKGEADDILTMRHGWILDTSIANIAFRKKDRWYTPAFPLLAGTTWKRMIEETVLIPKPIHQNDLKDFDGFKVFNAMNDWEDVLEMTMDGIISVDG